MGLFGGGNSKSKTTTNNTWNDNRSVNDAGGGVVGSGNTQDNSIQITDNSHTTNTTTDHGAVRAAVDMTEAAFTTAGELGSDALTLGRGAISGAFESSADALDFGRSTLADVVGLAQSVVSQAGSQAETAATILRGAQTDQADSSTGDRTLKIAAVAAVALVAAVVGFAALRK
jgi:hypothetical protein